VLLLLMVMWVVDANCNHVIIFQLEHEIHYKVVRLDKFLFFNLFPIFIQYLADLQSIF
jgi:hypothetical protein